MQLSWITHVGVYFIIWWVTIFAVLPWGNQPIDEEDVAKGQSAGAPKNPRLLLKIAINTVIATVIWGIFFLVVQFELISIRNP